MIDMVDACRIEAMHRAAKGIADAIAEAKQIHGENDPELARYLLTALLDAIIEETRDDQDLFNRAVEVLACYGRD